MARAGDGSMSEPVRWLEPGSRPPPGARDALSQMSGPPPMSSMVRARVGQRVSDFAREGPTSRSSSSIWLAAAMVGAACAGAFALVHAAGRRGDDGDAIVTRAAPAQKTAPAQAMPPPEPAPRERVGAPPEQDVVAPKDDEPAEQVDEQTETTVERTERVVERTERIEERRQRTERRRRVQRERTRAPDAREETPASRRLPPTPDLFEEGAAPIEHGTLSINTSPWARVLVDGEAIGHTPVIRHRLEPGVHDVRLESSDGTVSHMRVLVRAGQNVRVNHRGGSISAQMDVTFP